MNLQSFFAEPLNVFPVLLTDNGGEFSDVFAFENNSDGENDTRMFFCDPNSPDMFTFTYSEKLAQALGISYVDPKDVIQTSKLLKLFS